MVRASSADLKSSFRLWRCSDDLVKKKVFFAVIFVNILCGKSYFGKKSVSFLFHLATLKLSFEASSKPFFDRLDIFPDAIDVKNTMAVSILVLHRPLVR